jgi:hypothetical protein
MEPVSEALRLLKRQAEIQRQMRRPGGIPILEERELFVIRERLADYPAAVRAIMQLAGTLHTPVDQLRVEDVERWDGRLVS